MGNPHVFLLRAAACGVWRARGNHRTHSVERGQAAGDVRHDGVLGAVGAAAELARDGAGVWDQLGGGVSLGGMVGAVGLGPSGVARGGVDRSGRDSLGPWCASEQLPDRDLPDRRALPALAVGRKTAVAGDPAAGGGGTGARGGERVGLFGARQVGGLPESAWGGGRGGRWPGWTGYPSAAGRTSRGSAGAA